jgi:hypothetical protein
MQWHRYNTQQETMLRGRVFWALSEDEKNLIL